jgi:two-component system sensor histidine kinase PhoQ
MNSLKARLLLAATLILFAFVALTGVALQRGSQERAEQAERDKLQGLVYSLLGASGTDRSGKLRVNEGELRNSRLGQPDSGLYLQILDDKGGTLWQSASVLDALPQVALPPVGGWSFSREPDAAGNELFIEVFTVRWISRGTERTYSFIAAEDSREFVAQMHRFARVLWIWLLVPSVLLLVLQSVVLQWGLSPLRRLVAELRGIEGGGQAEIAGRYPSELQPLTGALNAMLRSERNQQTRYRHALDDLAHSLKTPLAVLSGEADRDELQPAQRERLQEQLGRMRQIVEYQLKKAAAAGSRSFTTPVPVRPLLQKLVAALGKVYQDKSVRYELDVADDVRLRMDSGDLMEMFGNLLDNASKWCRRRVRVSARPEAGGLRVRVEDDGPGFPDGEAELLLQRGARADQRVEGQGIGLAVVAEIIRASDGRLGLERSALGGAAVSLWLPQR